MKLIFGNSTHFELSFYKILCQVVVGFGYMTSCLAPSLPIALAIAAPMLIPLMIFGGFFLSSRQVIVNNCFFQYNISFHHKYFGNIFNLVQKFCCFIFISSVPTWLVWFKYIGWFLYTNELLNINQWEGVELDTCPNGTVPIPPCYTSGDEVIKVLGFDKVKNVKYVIESN